MDDIAYLYLTPKQREEVQISYKLEHLSVSAIARELGLTKEYVQSYIKHLNE